MPSPSRPCGCLIRKRVIPAVKIGRNVRVSEVELEKYLSAHQAGR